MRDGSASEISLPMVRRWTSWSGNNAILLPVVIVVLSASIFSLTVPHFADLRNLLNIIEQLGVLGFLAIGMTFVMVAGGIDLSCYTVVSAAAVVGATAMVDTESALLGCSLMLMVGLGFGVDCECEDAIDLLVGSGAAERDAVGIWEAAGLVELDDAHWGTSLEVGWAAHFGAAGRMGATVADMGRSGFRFLLSRGRVPACRARIEVRAAFCSPSHIRVPSGRELEGGLFATRKDHWSPETTDPPLSPRPQAGTRSWEGVENRRPSP